MVVSCFCRYFFSSVTFSPPFWFQIYLQDLSAEYVKIRLMMTCTVILAKSDSDVMFCLQTYHGLRIDRSLVY